MTRAVQFSFSYFWFYGYFAPRKGSLLSRESMKVE